MKKLSIALSVVVFCIGLISVSAFAEGPEQDVRYQLIDAIMNQDIAGVKKLFEDRATAKKIKINDMVNIGDGMVMTYLSAAVGTGKIEMVEYILSKKPDVNFANGGAEGITPLIRAAQSGYLDIIKLLITKKAQIDKKSKSGLTPLMMAVANGQIETVRLLLDNRANAKLTNDLGETLLIQAVKSGKTELVKMFLDKKYGINVNAKSRNKETALFIAYENKNRPAMDLLKEAGAKDDRVNFDEAAAAPKKDENKDQKSRKRSLK